MRRSVVRVLAGAMVVVALVSAALGDANEWGLVAFPLVGAVVLWHQPANRIGWLLASIGFLPSVAAVAGRLAPDTGFLAVALQPVRAAGLLGMGAVAVLVAVFPSGRLPSRRWRVPGAVATVAVVVEWLLDVVRVDNGPNPIGVAALQPVVAALFGPLGMVIAAFGLAALVHVFVRMRRATGEERQQLRWFVSGVAVFAVLVFASASTDGSRVAGVVFFLAWTVGFGAIAGGIGVAVLKHRLYDIDVFISRTLVFAGLAVFITAIYVAIVVGAGVVIGRGDSPHLGLSVAATAVVAVTFQPVRERLTRLANKAVFGPRASPYEVLSRMSAHLAETLPGEDLLGRMAQLLAEGTGAAHAQVSLLVGDHLVPVAAVGQADPAATAHTCEVRRDGELLGALSVAPRRGEALSRTETSLVDDLARQAGLVLRNVRLAADLRATIGELERSQQRLVATQAAERRRLERQLRDGPQRRVAALRAALRQARSVALGEGADRTADLVAELENDVDHCVRGLREFAHGVYPPLLAAQGLAAALTDRAVHAVVPTAVTARGLVRYPPEVEGAVYFSVLEALQNAAKYSQASHVLVELEHVAHELSFVVTDDGNGFDPAAVRPGRGTANMTDRVAAVGGRLEIDSRPGGGTTVRGRVPVGAPARAVSQRR